MRKVVRLATILVVVWSLCVILFVRTNFSDSFNSGSWNIRQTSLPRRNLKYNITSHLDYGAVKEDKQWLRRFKQKMTNQEYLNITKVEVQNTDTKMYDTYSENKVLILNKSLRAAGNKPETKAAEDIDNLAQVIRMRREDNERRYYTLRKTRVNPVDTKFIISGAQICSSDAKYMTILIIVPSIPSHVYVRDAIRSTYGSFAKNHFLLQHVAVDVTVRLMFLLGKDDDAESEKKIKKESRENGDIVYADFVESYRNLTRKMLIALKWVSVYCSDVDFVMKVDEDVFVNIPQLARDLHQRPYGIKGSVYGFINVHSSVRRAGKWGVSKDEFPLTHYPNYASGNSYVISGNIIPRMFMISEYLPYMPIEDAFITGCLARIVEANVVGVPGFTYWHDPVPDPCKFVRDRKISATKVTITIMLKLWKVTNNYQKYCKTF